MRKPLFALIGLLLSLLTASCSDGGAASDDKRHPVFYGGTIGGGTWP